MFQTLHDTDGQYRDVVRPDILKFQILHHTEGQYRDVLIPDRLKFQTLHDTEGKNRDVLRPDRLKFQTLRVRTRQTSICKRDICYVEAQAHAVSRAFMR